ncbi:MAG: UPF0175 family protein [Deltaproteobacteria bacterium]|nr:UPF0175 family protein [Deltaproteobacteria bacterium]
MPFQSVTINIPDTLPVAAKVHKSEMPGYIKKTLAVELYREGVLSLGKAAELAGVSSKWEMLTILNEKRVNLRYGAEDAEEDLKTLNELARS